MTFIDDIKVGRNKIRQKDLKRRPTMIIRRFAPPNKVAVRIGEAIADIEFMVLDRFRRLRFQWFFMMLAIILVLIYLWQNILLPVGAGLICGYALRQYYVKTEKDVISPHNTAAIQQQPTPQQKAVKERNPYIESFLEDVAWAVNIIRGHPDVIIKELHEEKEKKAKNKEDNINFMEHHFGKGDGR